MSVNIRDNSYDEKHSPVVVPSVFRQTRLERTSERWINVVITDYKDYSTLQNRRQKIIIIIIIINVNL